MTDVAFLKANRAAYPLTPGPVLFIDHFGFRDVAGLADNVPVCSFSASFASTVIADISFDKPLHGFMTPTVSFWSHVEDPYKPPKSVFIQDLGRPDLVPSRPIPVSLDFTYDLVTAHCLDLDEFGVGPDESAALDDLRASIASLYRSLKDDEGSLGPLPRKHWDYLRRMITER